MVKLHHQLCLIPHIIFETIRVKLNEERVKFLRLKRHAPDPRAAPVLVVEEVAESMMLVTDPLGSLLAASQSWLTWPPLSPLSPARVTGHCPQCSVRGPARRVATLTHRAPATARA